MFSSKVFKSAMLVMVWYPFKIWNWEVMLVALLVKNLYVKIFQHIFCLTRSRPNPVSFVCVCVCLCTEGGGIGLCLEGSLWWNMEI